MKRDNTGEVEYLRLVREVIAAGSVTRLDRCACGDLYLTVGPITMALHPEALADLHATLGRACAALAREPGASNRGRSPAGSADGAQRGGDEGEADHDGSEIGHGPRGHAN